MRRSLRHMYAQLIDDEKGMTIVQAGSIGGKDKADKSAIAKAVGERLAERAKEKGVSRVVFDRRGYLYHGRIKALADAARGNSLVF